MDLKCALWWQVLLSGAVVWRVWGEGLGAVCLHLLISVLIEMFVFIYSISSSWVATEKVSLELGAGDERVDNQALDS